MVQENQTEAFSLFCFFFPVLVLQESNESEWTFSYTSGIIQNWNDNQNKAIPV